MSYHTDSDRLDAHARQAWALSELLIDHFGGQEEHNVMSDEIMSGLMENISEHLKKIQEINAGQEVQS
ncbi:hypothetical protein [Chromohalobacter sp. 296-RDG]|uniref:hypothetical protein n=1 Tax=Chromohalobacter sp. 296-RDG TaxID=2994062 RepID=UPI0024683CA2|nr:hypothetical protein [Chromohalobacter sp. 296-RDG]